MRRRGGREREREGEGVIGQRGCKRSGVRVTMAICRVAEDCEIKLKNIRIITEERR